jgi:hypothetical protein
MVRRVAVTWNTESCPCCGDEGFFPCDSCHCCTNETTLYEIDVTISGVVQGDVNMSCSDCTSFNGTHRLVIDNSSDFCLFRKTGFDYCGYNTIRFQFDPGSCQRLELQFSDSISFSVPTNTFLGTWDPGNFDCTEIANQTWHLDGATSTSDDICDFSGASISVSVVSFATVPEIVTASFSSSCPEWDGAAVPLTYNGVTGRWEGEHDTGVEVIAVYLECVPGGFGINYHVRLGQDSSTVSCGNQSSDNATADYHPFSWGPFSLGTGGCLGCLVGLGDTLEVTVTE